MIAAHCCLSTQLCNYKTRKQNLQCKWNYHYEINVDTFLQPYTCDVRQKQFQVKPERILPTRIIYMQVYTIESNSDGQFDKPVVGAFIKYPALSAEFDNHNVKAFKSYLC